MGKQARHTPPNPPFVVIIRACGRSPGSRIIVRTGLPKSVLSVARSAELSAYSCGDSAGFSPDSLLAFDETRKNQGNIILGVVRLDCQYIDWRGAVFFVV